MSWEYKLGSFLKSVTDFVGVTPKNSAPSFSQLMVSGIVEKQEGNIENAVSAFKMAAFLNPASYEPYYHLGNCYAEAKNYRIAIYEYCYALQLASKPADVASICFMCHYSLCYIKEMYMARVFIRIASHLSANEKDKDACGKFFDATERMITNEQRERENETLSLISTAIKEKTLSEVMEWIWVDSFPAATSP